MARVCCSRSHSGREQSSCLAAHKVLRILAIYSFVSLYSTSIEILFVPWKHFIRSPFGLHEKMCKTEWWQGTLLFVCLRFLIYLFTYLLLLLLFLFKKRGVQKGVQKGGPEGRVHVLSTPDPTFSLFQASIHLNPCHPLQQSLQLLLKFN